MSSMKIPSVVRQMGSLFDGDSVAGLTDGQLIERFVARRDAIAEAAFTALVARYGPMVQRVCRQLLSDHQHAEDAFQAVFLVLARRAYSIRDPDLLSNWLYGVSLRTARKAKSRVAQQYRNEEESAVMRPEANSTRPADEMEIHREQAETLHEEIDRLPRSFRLPVVLCYFEGSHSTKPHNGCPARREQYTVDWSGRGPSCVVA
jgi:RNA polymerase sigma factor (sigma-70 family)